MRQGTISVLIGCHSVIHSYYVVKAWKHLYGEHPKLWEIVCILLHDIGCWGIDYLDYPEKKKDHWCLGAEIAYHLFGERGFILCAGHSSSSGHTSKLRAADKFSWLLANEFWLRTNCWTEPNLYVGNETSIEHVKRFKTLVKRAFENDSNLGSIHDLFFSNKSNWSNIH